MVAQLNIGFPLSANCSRAKVLPQESKSAGQGSQREPTARRYHDDFPSERKPASGGEAIGYVLMIPPELLWLAVGFILLMAGMLAATPE
jgi:hypothetical protein